MCREPRKERPYSGLKLYFEFWCFFTELSEEFPWLGYFEDPGGVSVLEKLFVEPPPFTRAQVSRLYVEFEDTPSLFPLVPLVHQTGQELSFREPDLLPLYEMSLIDIPIRPEGAFVFHA